ncbi:MAG: hypothetical protein ACKOPI_06465 [bacterium]
MGIGRSLMRGGARAGKSAGKIWLGRAAVVLAVAEALLAAKDHIWDRLTTEERARIYEITAKSKGRPSNLSQAEKDELKALVQKAEPIKLGVRTAQGGMVGRPKRKKR